MYIFNLQASHCLADRRPFEYEKWRIGEETTEKKRNNQISSGYYVYMWMVSKNKTNLILLRRGNIIKLPLRFYLIVDSSISSIRKENNKSRCCLSREAK